MFDTLFSNHDEGLRLANDKDAYCFAPMEFLPLPEEIPSEDELIAEYKADRKMLRRALDELKITLEKRITHTSSPFMIRYEVRPVTPAGVRKLLKSEAELSMLMNRDGIRTSICREKGYMVIEVPRRRQHTLHLRKVIESDAFVNATGKLNAAIGINAMGENVVIDLTKMPHMLIGGTTCSGKSVFINNILLSLLYTKTPDEVKLILIDPKKVEFSCYRDIPHLLTPVISSPQKAVRVLNSAVKMMKDRFALLEEMGVRNIADYNQTVGDHKLPYIVVVIEELADFMITSRKDITSLIAQLTQKGHAAGIHLIVATQRLAKDVLPPIITSNFAARVAMTTRCKKDSELILREFGAERLTSRGDMLFWPISELYPIRTQCCFTDYSVLDKVCDYIRKNNAPVIYDDALSAYIDECNELSK